MKIEIYALCHQEAQMIPYFMRHYNQYGQVFLLEGHSTDGSVELAKSLGAIICPIDTGNEIRDDIFTSLKNDYWKRSDADWVIMCDLDEFIYHPDFKEYLSSLKETIISPTHYEMFSDVFPTTEGQIYEEVTMGAQTAAKLCLFKPKGIKEMNYTPGCHSASPTGNVSINTNNEIIAMHMRHLSLDYVMDRNAYFKQRRSIINKQNGWGNHLESSREDVQSWFDHNKPQLTKVL